MKPSPRGARPRRPRGGEPPRLRRGAGPPRMTGARSLGWTSSGITPERRRSRSSGAGAAYRGGPLDESPRCVVDLQRHGAWRHRNAPRGRDGGASSMPHGGDPRDGCLRAEPEMPGAAVEEVSEDGMPVLTAEPENPEDLAAISQHEELPASAAPELPAPTAPAEDEPRWRPSSRLPPSRPRASPPCLSDGPRASARAGGQPEAGGGPSGRAPRSAGASGPGAGSPRGARASGVGCRCLCWESWRSGGAGRRGCEQGAFAVGAQGFSARVDGELLTRLEGLVAFTGALAFKPEMKRFRGRMTDKPFGDGLGADGASHGPGDCSSSSLGRSGRSWRWIWATSRPTSGTSACSPSRSR